MDNGVLVSRLRWDDANAITRKSRDPGTLSGRSSRNGPPVHRRVLLLRLIVKPVLPCAFDIGHGRGATLDPFRAVGISVEGDDGYFNGPRGS